MDTILPAGPDSPSAQCPRKRGNSTSSSELHADKSNFGLPPKAAWERGRAGAEVRQPGRGLGARGGCRRHLRAVGRILAGRRTCQLRRVPPRLSSHRPGSRATALLPAPGRDRVAVRLKCDNFQGARSTAVAAPPAGRRYADRRSGCSARVSGRSSSVARASAARLSWTRSRRASQDDDAASVEHRP